MKYRLLITYKKSIKEVIIDRFISPHIIRASVPWGDLEGLYLTPVKNATAGKMCQRRGSVTSCPTAQTVIGQL